MTGIDVERILSPGEDFPYWPSAKLLHAQELGRSLGDAIKTWREGLGPETSTELAENGLSGVVRARLVEHPPVAQWSLLLGDVIHNYRSSLDSLTWALAHLDGRTPHERVRRRIQFPFARSRTEWGKLVRTELASIPQFAIERLDRVQPYHVEPVDKGIGLTLHRLDIEDKHKALLEIRLIAEDKTAFTMLAKSRDHLPEGVVPFLPSEGWRWVAPESGLRDGDEVWKFRVEHPLEELIVPKLPLSIQVVDEYQNVDIWDLLRHIDAQVVATFNTIYLGDDTDEHKQFMAERNLRYGTPAAQASDEKG